MRDRPGDPVLAEEQRMLPPTTGACSFGGRGYPSWCAEQAVKLPDGVPRRLGARAGSELLWAVLRYRRYGPGPHRQPTLAYGLLMVLLGGGYGRAVLRPGQLVGQDFSLVVAGATLAVAAVFQLPAAASSGWWTGASTCAATTPADDRPMS